MAQGHLQWDQEELFEEKTEYKKSRETAPLNGIHFCIEKTIQAFYSRNIYSQVEFMYIKYTFNMQDPQTIFEVW